MNHQLSIPSSIRRRLRTRLFAAVLAAACPGICVLPATAAPEEESEPASKVAGTHSPSACASPSEQVIVEDYDPEDDIFELNEYDEVFDADDLNRDSDPDSDREKDLNSRNWWTLLKHRKLNLADTTVIYPKFLGFCVKVYNWADRVFNSYDPEYVVGTGRRWKARILADTWLDSYLLKPTHTTPIRMMSDPYINTGAYIQYMAVSLGYSFDIGNIFRKQGNSHNKFEYTFNCARFNVEGHYWENHGGTYIRTFGDYNNGHLIKKHLSGVNMKFFEIYGYFFFNNRKFSMGASYNFSKLQKRSAGSAIIGIDYSNNDISIDFSKLPPELLPYLTIDPKKYTFHYKSLSIMSGYSYNLVCNPHLLFNISVFPSVGAASTYADNVDEDKNLFALGIKALSSLTYNLGDFFICGVAKMNGCFYSSKNYSFFSSVENAQLSIGWRF